MGVFELGSVVRLIELHVVHVLRYLLLDSGRGSWLSTFSCVTSIFRCGFLVSHPKQCAKQPACLGLNTERPVHRTGTGPALFMPRSDAPGLSAHTLVVRSQKRFRPIILLK